MPNIRRNTGFRIPAQRLSCGTHSGIRGLPAANPAVTRISAYSPRPVPAATSPAGLPRQQMQCPSPQTAKAPSGNMTPTRHPVPAATAPAGLPRQQVQCPLPSFTAPEQRRRPASRHYAIPDSPPPGLSRRKHPILCNMRRLSAVEPCGIDPPRVPDNGRLFLTARRCGSVRRPAAYGGTRYPPLPYDVKCSP